MTKFNSDRLTINAPASQVFDFLSDFTHFEPLMPDQVNNYKAKPDSCSFAIEGIAELNMRIASKVPNKNIHIVSDGKNPIDYTLDIFLLELDENTCLLEVDFNGKMNPFIKMMASKPLQKFVDTLAIKVQEYFA